MVTCNDDADTVASMIAQNLDGWKLRRRKQSEEAIVRVSEIKRVADQEQENGGRRKS